MQMIGQKDKSIDLERMPVHYIFKRLPQQLDFMWFFKNFDSPVRHHCKKIGSTFDPCPTISHGF
jgi:hypothetical protein